MQTITKESLKDINLKQARFCHIYKSEVIVYMEKTDKNGIKTEWAEKAPHGITISLGRLFNKSDEIEPAYDSVYFDRSKVGFLKDISLIRYYSDNSSPTMKEMGIRMESIVLELKNGTTVEEHRHNIDGKKTGFWSISLIRNSGGLGDLFKRSVFATAKETV